MRFDVTLTLKAAQKAQQELSDSGSFDYNRVKNFLEDQGYDINFSHNDWIINNGQGDIILNQDFPIMIHSNSTSNNYESNFKTFELINYCRNPWVKNEEELLYVPNQLYLFFGGENISNADVYLYINNDPCWDEIPYIGINKNNPEALEFLLGKDYQSALTPKKISKDSFDWKSELKS